jgi:transcriptional regulator with XRE-family HTH domain
MTTTVAGQDTCGELASRSRYVRGCRCTDCRAASREYGSAYWFNHRKRYEGNPDVPVTPELMNHLKNLQSAGMGYRAIADTAGIGRKTVAELLRGDRIRGVRPATYQALMAVQGSPSWAPAVGITRRLRGLAMLGWRQTDISTKSGVAVSVINELMAGNQQVCMRTHAAALKECYEQLSMRVGPSERSRNRATAKGWAPTLAWDDDAIDDPAAKPVGVIGSITKAAGVDESAIERRILGDRTARLHKGESAEVVRRLLADGWTQNAIRRHTGLKPDRYIDRSAKRDRKVAA